MDKDKTTDNYIIMKQLESVTETLQMIYMDKECPEYISNILYNQIGILVFTCDYLKQSNSYYNYKTNWNNV